MCKFQCSSLCISMSTQLHQLQCVYCSGSQPVDRDPTWSRHRFSVRSPLVVRHFTKSMHNCTSIMFALVFVRNCALSPTRKTISPNRGKISPTRGTICLTWGTSRPTLAIIRTTRGTICPIRSNCTLLTIQILCVLHIFCILNIGVAVLREKNWDRPTQKVGNRWYTAS